jgi:hypothetical protein
MNGNAADWPGKADQHPRSQPLKPVLDADTSRVVGQRLCDEVAALASVEAADEWASRSIGAKNGLTAEDAAAVEVAFRDRMQVLQPEVYSLTSTGSAAPSPPQAWTTTPHRLLSVGNSVGQPR